VVEFSAVTSDHGCPHVNTRFRRMVTEKYNCSWNGAYIGFSISAVIAGNLWPDGGMGRPNTIRGFSFLRTPRSV
jgi:hypothetical protein